MSNKIIKLKPLMALSLPCAARFPKKEVNKQLKKKLSELENVDDKIRNSSQFIDITGTSGGYEEAFNLINQNKKRFNIVLVGWSMGGAAALMLTDVCDGVAGVVTLGAAAHGNNIKGIYRKNIPYLQCHNKYDEVISINKAKKLYRDLNGMNNENHTFEISEIQDGNCHQYDDVIDMSTDWILDHFVKNQ